MNSLVQPSTPTKKIGSLSLMFNDTGTTAQRHNGTTAQRHNGTTAQRHNGTTAQLNGLSKPSFLLSL
jgi:hypothetical protein